MNAYWFLQKDADLIDVHSGCVRVLATLIVTSLLTGPSPVRAEMSAVKMTKLEGVVDLTHAGPAPYVLEGTASHLGKFRAFGEVVFTQGQEPGKLIGTGPVVFEAASGARLVGVATWKIDPSAGAVPVADIHFAWRDSVEFSNRTVVTNTGRFVKARPPGLVVVVSREERTQGDLIALIIRIIFRR